MLERKCEKYPEGKIHIVKNKDRVQYYLRTDPKDKSGVYLQKKQKDKIELYLQKRYDEEALKLIQKEIESLEILFKKTESINYKIQNLYSNNPPEIQNHIEPLDMSNQDYAKQWQAKAYQKKELASNVPVYITERGEQVRSKSELNIANRLFKMNIPYKYECAFPLSNGRVFYPDFTVLEMRTRREIYWEHRGMMDNRDYANHSVQRIKEYNHEGIYLGENLIITEETSTLPLGTREIEKIIMHYFF